MASDIKKASYTSDILGRVGVGRFVVFMRDTGGLNNIMKKAEQLRAIIDNTYVGELNQGMKGTVGAVVAPIEGGSFEELLEKAEKAMLYAGEHSNNGIEIYDRTQKSIYSEVYDIKMQGYNEPEPVG